MSDIITTERSPNNYGLLLANIFCSERYHKHHTAPIHLNSLLHLF